MTHKVVGDAVETVPHRVVDRDSVLHEDTDKDEKRKKGKGRGREEDEDEGREAKRMTERKGRTLPIFQKTNVIRVFRERKRNICVLFDIPVYKTDESRSGRRRPCRQSSGIVSRP